jgi:plastocyanin
MYKKVLVGLLVFGVLTALLAACSIRDETANTGPAVHMGGANFIVPSITIHKGDTLTLVDDAPVPHEIFNGSWVGSNQVKKTESGAPVANDIKFSGNDTAPLGTFNTAGTFHYYCSIHPGMNLTVVVQ